MLQSVDMVAEAREPSKLASLFKICIEILFKRLYETVFDIDMISRKKASSNGLNILIYMVF